MYLYIYMLYIDMCTCICLYIYTYIKEKKREFCLRCAQGAADKRHLKLSFKLQPYPHQSLSWRGRVSCLSLAVRVWDGLPAHPSGCRTQTRAGETASAVALPLCAE